MRSRPADAVRRGIPGSAANPGGAAKAGSGKAGDAPPGPETRLAVDGPATGHGAGQERDRDAGDNALAILPGNLDQVYRVARTVLKAGLAPLSYTHERGRFLSEEAVVARLVIGILKGTELGFAPLTALSAIAIIGKKPCLYGDGASALIQSRGHLGGMVIEEIGTIPAPGLATRNFAEDFGVRVTMWRRGQREPYIGQFTVGDAKRARLWLDPRREPWIKYPRRQLKWRAFAWPARDGFADDLMGLGIAEEMLDVPPEPPPKTDTGFLDDGLPPGAPSPETGTQHPPKTKGMANAVERRAGASPVPASC